jgi:hypothetical protein
MVVPVHKNTNAPLIFENLGHYFLGGANHIMGPFSGYFEGASTFLTPKLSLAALGTILGVKKVLAPSKYPLKWPIMLFARKKKKYPAFSKSAVQ